MWVNGNIENIEMNKQGKVDGDFQAFHENGIKSAIGQYKDGKREGVFCIFDEKGELIEQIKFENGEQINDR